MNQKNLVLLGGLLLLLLHSCVAPTNPYNAAAPGIWKGVLYLDNKTPIRPAQEFEEKGGSPDYSEKLEDELPFLFEINYPEERKMTVTVINGEERIILKDVSFGRDRTTARDTVRINFPVFDSHIHAVFEEGVMQGFWYLHNKPNYKIPFAAFYGQKDRFIENLEIEDVENFDGKWRVNFGDEDEDDPAIAEFEQEGKNLNGTFRTPTGDYRFLAGIAEGGRMYLSTFDGAHAFLFHAKMQEDGTLLGFFKSGNHYETTWTAKRDDEFELPTPDSLTFLTNGYEEFRVTFPDEYGDLVTIGTEADLGKVQIVQILGTWCPNCRDEVSFLKEYLKQNPNPDLQVIGLAFERYSDERKARTTIAKYREKMGIDYPILHAGSYRKAEASKSLPMLNAVISYPTLIFIDKKNKVRRIHTGFEGPATSNYESITKDIIKTIDQLLAE